MHTCIICNDIFSSRSKLFQHVGNYHTDKKSGTIDTLNENSSEMPNKTKKIVVVDEDSSWYRVVIKPQGMPTMGGISGLESLINSDCMLLPDAIKSNFSYKKAIPCHRLDQETGGLVVCSKSKLAESLIMQSFRNHVVLKRYMAIVIGKINPSKGKINSPIKGQESITEYEVTDYTRSRQYGWITTLNLWPITGRNHQLRKHLAGLGHPIVGDKRYSTSLQWLDITNPFYDYLFLWSVEISFPHPEDYYHTINKKEEIRQGDEVPLSVESTNESLVPLYRRVRVQIDEPPYYGTFRRSQHGGGDEQHAVVAVPPRLAQDGLGTDLAAASQIT